MGGGSHKYPQGGSVLWRKKPQGACLDVQPQVIQLDLTTVGQN